MPVKICFSYYLTPTYTLYEHFTLIFSIFLRHLLPFLLFKCPPGSPLESWHLPISTHIHDRNKHGIHLKKNSIIFFNICFHSVKDLVGTEDMKPAEYNENKKRRKYEKECIDHHGNSGIDTGRSMRIQTICDDKLEGFLHRPGAERLHGHDNMHCPCEL